MSPVDGRSMSRDVAEYIARRQAFGVTKYGHGIRREDDTRVYGTTNDCWWEMAQEELGDAINYVACARLRREGARATDEVDDNENVVRAVLEGKDALVQDLVRLWTVCEREKGARARVATRFSVAVVATFLLGFMCGRA